jgi:hypothetical protein
MSFDLGVWYSDAPMSVEQARSYYAHINSDWVDLRRRPEFDEFLTTLRARFPDPRAPDARPADPDEPPGSLMMSVGELMSRVKSEPAPPPLTPEQMDEWRRTSPTLQAEMENPSPELSLNPTGSGLAISISWSDVETVAPVVVDIAARANVLVYDPQNRRVFVPPALAGKAASAIAPPRVTLQVVGNAPNVHATITLDERVLLEVTVPSRREAHRHARDLALGHGLDHYAVDDPRSLSQSMTLKPMSPDNPLRAITLPPGAEAFELGLRGEDE